MSHSSDHIGVPDAELYAGDLRSWASEVSEVARLINEGNHALATFKLGKLWSELKDRDEQCTIAWEDYELKCSKREGESPQAAGGRARAASMTPDERKAVAKKAATARWRGNGGNPMQATSE